MNKRDLTEVGIKLIAVYMILTTLPRLIVGVFALARLTGLGQLQRMETAFPADFHNMSASLIGGLIVLLFWMIVIRKAEWIVGKVYPKQKSANNSVHGSLASSAP